MNKDKFEGKWHEFKGNIKDKWGRITDDDMMQINGKYEKFLGTLQKRYGYEKERAEREFSNWNWQEESTVNDDSELDRDEERDFGQQRKKRENDRFDQDKWNREENRNFKNKDMDKGQDRGYGK